MESEIQIGKEGQNLLGWKGAALTLNLEIQPGRVSFLKFVKFLG